MYLLRSFCSKSEKYCMRYIRLFFCIRTSSSTYLQASTYTKLDFVLEPIAANKWAFINVCLGYAVCIIKRFTKSRFSKKEMHCKASNENCTNITFVREKKNHGMKFFLQLKSYMMISQHSIEFLLTDIGCGLTSKNEFSSSPIREFRVLQNVFRIKKA